MKCKGQCPGYRDPADLKFHHKDLSSYVANALAADNATLGSSITGKSNALIRTSTRRLPSYGSGSAASSRSASRGAGQKNTFPTSQPPEETDSQAAHTTKCNAILVSSTRRSPLLLSPQLAEHWETHAVPLMLNEVSIPLNGRRWFGYLSFLPDLYQESEEDSCLHLTTNAVFLIYMARRKPDSFRMKNAARVYGRALASVNASLRDPTKCLEDGTLMAIWLLGQNDVRQLL